MTATAPSALLALAAVLGGCEVVAGIKSRPLAGSGSGGSAAGTTAGTIGAAGSSGAGGSGGTGGSIGGTGGQQTRIGTSCPTLAALDCDGQMSRQTLACGAGYLWTANTYCPLGQLCDSRPGDTHGTCLTLIPECADHAPDDHVCIGGQLRACGPDLIDSTAIDLCQDPTGECARCKPVLLALASTRASAIAVDVTYVYWTSTGIGAHAWRAPKDGSGDVTDLGSLWPGTSPGARTAGSLAIADGFLYAMSTDMVNFIPCRIPLDGGQAVAIDSSGITTGGQTTVAVAGGNVYWTASTYLGGAVLKVPSTGGTSTPLATNQGTINAITVDATSVYWTTSNGSVGQASIDGSSTQTIASGQPNPRGIAVMAGNLYWTSDSKIMTMPVTGGMPVQLNATPSGSSSLVIAIDAMNIYWPVNVIMRMPRLGGTPVTVSSAAAPLSLAIDETHIYWGNSGDGTIVKIAK